MKGQNNDFSYSPVVKRATGRHHGIGGGWCPPGAQVLRVQIERRQVEEFLNGPLEPFAEYLIGGAMGLPRLSETKGGAK
jgi:hypothetical protein